MPATEVQEPTRKSGFKSVGGSGGAIYGAGSVILTSSTISGCSAGTGGAVETTTGAMMAAMAVRFPPEER